ncbi:MAG: mechanosensitive ion channel family protein [Actinomycetota bacterium]
MGEITSNQWLVAGAYVVGSIILGWIVAKIIGAKLHKAASLTSMHLDDVFVGAITPVIEWWFFAGGLFAAKLTLEEHLAPRYDRLLQALLLMVLIGAVTIAAARIAADSVRLYSIRTSGAVSSSSLFVTLAKITVYSIGLLVLLQSLGVSVAPLLAALGVGGLAVALALQPTLANLFSGIQLLASGKLRPGDYIAVDGGWEGYIEDINWRNTTLRQLPNNHIVIPNSKLSESVLTNFYLPATEMSVRIECGVAYGTDLAKVERLTIEVAKEAMAALPAGSPIFEPFVRFTEFGDSSVNFNTILRVNEVVDQHLLRHEFVMRLHKRFELEGIEIPFPQRVIHSADKP